jgi:hypothetical protein
MLFVTLELFMLHLLLLRHICAHSQMPDEMWPREMWGHETVHDQNKITALGTDVCLVR